MREMPGEAAIILHCSEIIVGIIIVIMHNYRYHASEMLYACVMYGMFVTRVCIAIFVTRTQQTPAPSSHRIQHQTEATSTTLIHRVR